MKAAKLRRLVEVEVLRQLDVARMADGYMTLTIHFENTAVSIPYEPWRPRTDVTLPGRWVNGEDT